MSDQELAYWWRTYADRVEATHGSRQYAVAARLREMSYNYRKGNHSE